MESVRKGKIKVNPHIEEENRPQKLLVSTEHVNPIHTDPNDEILMGQFDYSDISTRYNICYGDILTLAPKAYLNDEIINYYY